MKLFIYKSLIVIFLVFVLFHTTIGYVLRDYEAKIYNTFDKEKISFIREKIREEIKDGINSDRILSQEDAALLNDFINKIRSEINSSK
tara:strand:- start:157 stop:420 length:264 start_codon:yes stop_codon:yes gene_type:complete